MDDREREFWFTRRRALLSEVGAIEQMLGIEKPIVYVPGLLDDRDQREIAKHCRIVQKERPATA